MQAVQKVRRFLDLLKPGKQKIGITGFREAVIRFCPGLPDLEILRDFQKP